MGVPRENIVVWPKNGIEFYYPSEIIDRLFGKGPDPKIEGDQVSRNGVSYTKGDLVNRVVGLLDSGTQMNGDFDTMLLRPLETKIVASGQ